MISSGLLSLFLEQFLDWRYDTEPVVNCTLIFSLFSHPHNKFNLIKSGKWQLWRVTESEKGAGCFDLPWVCGILCAPEGQVFLSTVYHLTKSSLWQSAATFSTRGHRLDFPASGIWSGCLSRAERIRFYLSHLYDLRLLINLLRVSVSSSTMYMY